jgi:hypothetical protein
MVVLVAEVLGIVLATIGGFTGLYGFVDTFRTYHPGEGIPAPLWRMIREVGRQFARTGQAVARAFKRLRQRFRRGVVVEGLSAVVTATASVNASGVIMLAKMDTDRPLADVVKDLQAQTVQHVRGQVDVIGGRVDKLEKVTTDVAVGGIRTQFLGLFLVTVGTLLAGLTPVVQAMIDSPTTVTCQSAASAHSSANQPTTFKCTLP